MVKQVKPEPMSFRSFCPGLCCRPPPAGLPAPRAPPGSPPALVLQAQGAPELWSLQADSVFAVKVTTPLVTLTHVPLSR